MLPVGRLLATRRLSPYMFTHILHDIAFCHHRINVRTVPAAPNRLNRVVRLTRLHPTDQLSDSSTSTVRSLSGLVLHATVSVQPATVDGFT